MDSKTDPATTLDHLFRSQSRYQERLRRVEDEGRQEEMRRLCLALHAEVTDLSRCINIRPHGEDVSVNHSKVLYDTVDVFRYTIAILNNWGFDAQDLMRAYSEKDAYLNMSLRLSQNVYDGRPVVICDMDDVLTEFREGFFKWITRTYGVVVDPQSCQYYMTDELKDVGVSPEAAFNRFLASGGMYDLDAVPGAVQMIQRLADAGMWIHIVTSRPEDNPACKYNTYMWLRELGVACHKISFTSEKYLWLIQSGYTDSVVCAIDDSSKHAAEYIKHKVRVLCPRKNYNQDLGTHDLLHWYDEVSEVPSIVASLPRV